MTINCNKHCQGQQPAHVKLFVRPSETSFFDSLMLRTHIKQGSSSFSRKLKTTAQANNRRENAIDMRLTLNRQSIRSSRFQYFALRARFGLYLRNSLCYISHPRPSADSFAKLLTKYKFSLIQSTNECASRNFRSPFRPELLADLNQDRIRQTLPRHATRAQCNEDAPSIHLGGSRVSISSLSLAN